MATGLLIVYRVLGVALLVLAVAMLVEKYRTVRGGTLCAGRILRCEKAADVNKRQGSGGYCYWVELHQDGERLECRTNDSFWFNHEKSVGKAVQVWYKPGRPAVERHSFGTEILAAATVAAGVAFLLI